MLSSMPTSHVFHKWESDNLFYNPAWPWPQKDFFKRIFYFISTSDNTICWIKVIPTPLSRFLRLEGSVCTPLMSRKPLASKTGLKLVMSIIRIMLLSEHSLSARDTRREIVHVVSNSAGEERVDRDKEGHRYIQTGRQKTDDTRIRVFSSQK